MSTSAKHKRGQDDDDGDDSKTKKPKIAKDDDDHDSDISDLSDAGSDGSGSDSGSGSGSDSGSDSGSGSGSGSDSGSGSESDNEQDEKKSKTTTNKQDDTKVWTAHILTTGGNSVDVFYAVSQSEAAKLQKMNWQSLQFEPGFCDSAKLVQIHKFKHPINNQGSFANRIWQIIIQHALKPTK